MELKAFGMRAVTLLKKYKFVVLVLVIGIVLMLLPSGSEKPSAKAENPVEQVALEDELTLLLSQIEGAGKVSVMLTVEKGEETLYQTNERTSESTGGNSIERDTVTVTDSQRNETGLIKQVNPARYLGAVVVCQGADDPRVRLSVVDAVSKLTGLGADRISVVKMK